VLGQAEDTTIVNANALKHAVTIQKAVVEDADLGFGFVNDVTVEVDFQGHE
jgi:hypothetical protein